VGAYQRVKKLSGKLKPEGRGDPSLLFIFWDCVAAPSSAAKISCVPPMQGESLIFFRTRSTTQKTTTPRSGAKPRLPRIYTGAIPRNYLGARAEQSCDQPMEAGAPYRGICREHYTTKQHGQSCIAAQNTPGSISTRNELSAAARHNIPATRRQTRRPNFARTQPFNTKHFF
jgi:hypothetical protein